MRSEPVSRLPPLRGRQDPPAPHWIPHFPADLVHGLPDLEGHGGFSLGPGKSPLPGRAGVASCGVPLTHTVVLPDEDTWPLTVTRLGQGGLLYVREAPAVEVWAAAVEKSRPRFSCEKRGMPEGEDRQGNSKWLHRRRLAGDPSHRNQIDQAFGPEAAAGCRARRRPALDPSPSSAAPIRAPCRLPEVEEIMTPCAGAAC
jgi:hypothetical protein